MNKERIAAKRSAWYKILYIQVLIAVVIGIAIGHFFPKTGMALKPLGDAFVSLIRMMIAPVIFCVIVQGIASMSDLKKVGHGRNQDAGLLRTGIDAGADHWNCGGGDCQSRRGAEY